MLADYSDRVEYFDSFGRGDAPPEVDKDLVAFVQGYHATEILRLTYKDAECTQIRDYLRVLNRKIYLGKPIFTFQYVNGIAVAYRLL
jgi:hypothetical protein